MISETELELAEYVIDASGAVEILASGMNGKRGPKQEPGQLRLLLLGLFLSIRHHGRGTVLEAHRVLTQNLPHSAKLRLGVVTVHADGRTETISTDVLFRWTKKISERLGYSKNTHPELDDTERTRRHQVIRDYCDAMMDVFAFAATSTMFALDATGLHAWSVARRSVTEDDNSEPANDPAGEKDVASTPKATTSGKVYRRGRNAFDADAAFGYRSARNGEESRFFGYHEHTLVQVPDDSHPHDDIEPRLIRRFEITPANADVVAPSLSLFDRLKTPITDLIADRHYHYKAYDRWKVELDRRGIRQHHDLRADESVFEEFDHMRWIGGYAHCPATPEIFNGLTRPSFDANFETRETFFATIEARELWVMQRHTQPDHTGRHRVACPALAGKIGCPLRAGTVVTAIENGLPIVENPPTTGPKSEPLPKCCTQRTMTTSPPQEIRKTQQPHYWASRAWDRVWKRRTYVEGSYGNRKNVSNENMRRGITRIPGLAFTHITVALVNASYNLRMVRNWHDRTGLGDPDHPLLKPDEGPGEWDFVTTTSGKAA